MITFTIRPKYIVVVVVVVLGSRPLLANPLNVTFLTRKLSSFFGARVNSKPKLSLICVCLCYKVRFVAHYPELIALVGDPFCVKGNS